MKKASTIKNNARLWNHTNLRPKLNKGTRWSSTNKMLKRFIKLEDILSKLAVDKIDKLLPNVHENRKIKKLLTKLSDLNSVTTALQICSISLFDVRLLFDGVIEEFPEPADKLGPDAQLVCDVDFESAVVKILDINVSPLTENESGTVKHLKRKRENTTATDTQS